MAFVFVLGLIVLLSALVLGGLLSAFILFVLRRRLESMSAFKRTIGKAFVIIGSIMLTGGLTIAYLANLDK